VRNADRITAALLLACAVAFSAGALKYYSWSGPGGPGSAFLPFWLGLLMALLAGTMLVRSLRQRDAGEDWLPRGEGLRQMLVVLAVTVAFVALLKVLGMVLGTALFLAVLLRRLGRHAWWLTLAIAAGAAGFNYLVFAHWLRVPFPAGMLWIF
jgi:putative tricarboxylic transport membrane protein